MEQTYGTSSAKEPWGIYLKIRPDHNGNFSLNQIPPETYEPPATPKGKLRLEINHLVGEFKYCIKHKLINRLCVLIRQAKDLAAGELEIMICHAELVVK